MLDELPFPGGFPFNEEKDALSRDGGQDDVVMLQQLVRQCFLQYEALIDVMIIIKMEDEDPVRLFPEIKELPVVLPVFRPIGLSRKIILEELFLGDGKDPVQALLDFLIDLLLLLFFIKSLYDLFKGLLYLLFVARLQKIVLDVIFHDAFGIFKLIIAREDDEPDMGVDGMHLLDELDPVHPWHLDIGNDDIDGVFPDPLVGHHPIMGLVRQFRSALSPADEGCDPLQDIQFIICNQYAIHVLHLRYKV